jgi:hypothetical protein
VKRPRPDSNLSRVLALGLLVTVVAGLGCKRRLDNDRTKYTFDELEEAARKGQPMTQFDIAHGGPARAKRLRELGDRLDDQGLCTTQAIRDAPDADEYYEACAIALGNFLSTGSHINEFRKTFPTKEAITDVCRRMKPRGFLASQQPDPSLARWAMVEQSIFCDVPVYTESGDKLTPEQVTAGEAQALAERIAGRRAERERKDK